MVRGGSVPESMGSTVGITDARVLGSDLRFHEVATLDWVDGVFATALEPATRSPRIEGHGLWVVPGFVDAHVHLAWTDFVESDRAARHPDDRSRLIEQNLAATVSAGFTGARDAGGLDRAWIDRVNSGDLVGPRISGGLDLITRASADSAGGVGPAVERVLEEGAHWVKLVATEGVASPESEPLDSHFSREEFQVAVDLAADVDARVMVHAWGGEAITWAIEAGVGSIEHGIFLTSDQAREGAARGTTFVPTVAIYRLVLEMIDDGRLPTSLRPRVAHAVEAHPAAVRLAREAGMPIAVGTDFGTADQHGTNLRELEALLGVGLSPTEVLQAATATGAALLGGRGIACPPGAIEPGAPADAVIFDRDPLAGGNLADSRAIVAVVRAGHVLNVRSKPGPSPEPFIPEAFSSIHLTPREHHPS